MFHEAQSLILSSGTERLPEDGLLWIEFPTGSLADIGCGGSVVKHPISQFSCRCQRQTPRWMGAHRLHLAFNWTSLRSFGRSLWLNPKSWQSERDNRDQMCQLLTSSLSGRVHLLKTEWRAFTIIKIDQIFFGSWWNCYTILSLNINTLLLFPPIYRQMIWKK